MPEWLRNMEPGKRRAVIAIGIGAALAAFVMIRRGGSGGSGTDPNNASSPAGGSDSASATGPEGSSTFADNGAALGELQTTLSGIAGTLSTVVDHEGTTDQNIADTNTALAGLGASIESLNQPSTQPDTLATSTGTAAIAPSAPGKAKAPVARKLNANQKAWQAAHHPAAKPVAKPKPKPAPKPPVHKPAKTAHAPARKPAPVHHPAPPKKAPAKKHK